MGSVLLRVVLGAGFAAAMIGGPAIGRAQPAPAPADPQTKATAKKLVDDAQVAFDAGDYDKAIELFRQAHELIPHPELMFNMAQAHRLAGRPDKAVPLYERYLQREPDGRQAGPARAALADIKAAGAPRPGGATPTEPGEPGPTTPAQTERELPADGAAAERRQTELDGVRDRGASESARPGQGLRTTGVVLGGLGLVSAGVGVYFTTQVLAAEDDAAAIAQGGGSLDEVKQRGEAAQRNGDIAYALGGALIIGGAVTYYLGYRKDRDVPAAALAPIVRPDFAGVAIAGRWR